MAWNPSPEVAPLRDYAKKFDRPVVVVFAIERGGDRFRVLTYGETKKLCKLAAWFGDSIAEAVADGTISAPLIEPTGPTYAEWVWRKEAVTNEGERKPE